VQGEHYYGPQGGVVDAEKLAAERPDAVVFNGYADQYFHDPVSVRVGERLRIWVLAAGPNRGTSFHVVGGQFSTTYAEGAYLLRDGGPDGTGGAQALALAPAQGGFVELTLPEAGNYPFVSHAMVDAERGARGVLPAVARRAPAARASARRASGTAAAPSAGTNPTRVRRSSRSATSTAPSWVTPKINSASVIPPGPVATSSDSGSPVAARASSITVRASVPKRRTSRAGSGSAA